MFGEINNYQQEKNGYLEFDITLRKTGGNFKNIDGDGNVDEPIRLIINAFAYAFSIATLPTREGEEKEQNKDVGHVSTIMRFLTSKDGDLISYFDEIDETQNAIKRSSLSQMLIDNHEEVDRRG